jgi:chloride channel, nucleotide-sensitive, 1A
MEAMIEPPQSSTFIPLAEHRSATPASFYSGPPVLHYYSDRSKLLVLERDVSSNALLLPLFKDAKGTHENGDAPTNGTSAATDESQRVIEDVDVWVASR